MARWKQCKPGQECTDPGAPQCRCARVNKSNLGPVLEALQAAMKEPTAPRAIEAFLRAMPGSFEVDGAKGSRTLAWGRSGSMLADMVRRAAPSNAPLLSRPHQQDTRMTTVEGIAVQSCRVDCRTPLTCKVHGCRNGA